MKNLLFLIILLTALIAGCGDDDDPAQFAETGTITISGKIDGWNWGENKTLYAADHHFNWDYFDLRHSLGSCKISADGSFNLKVAEPHPLMMDSLINYFPKNAFTSGVHLYSPNAKYCDLKFYIGEKDSIVGSLDKYGRTPEYTSDYNGDYYERYIYLDTAAVINGTYNYNFIGSRYTTYFDIDFKQGWNKYTHYYESTHIDTYMSDEKGEVKFVYKIWPGKYPIAN